MYICILWLGPLKKQFWSLSTELIQKLFSFLFSIYPQVEKQVRREEALERLLARQEETAVLVRGLAEQVLFVCISF